MHTTPTVLHLTELSDRTFKLMTRDIGYNGPDQWEIMTKNGHTWVMNRRMVEWHHVQESEATLRAMLGFRP